SELPPMLVANLNSAEPSVALATVVNQHHIHLSAGTSIRSLLASSSVDRQLTGARLLGSPDVPLPDPAFLSALSPFVIPAMARALNARPDVSDALWVDLLQTTARRAQLAPRLWGNAWRAVRDAIPANHPELYPALQAAANIASQANGLPASTAS